MTADDINQKVSAKNKIVLNSDCLSTKMDELTVTESDGQSGSKVEEELILRYWKTLQAHLALAGVDLQV